MRRVRRHRSRDPIRQAGPAGLVMHPFSFVQAPDEASARDALSSGAARVLAGGTTLVDLMKLDVERPSVVVDISRLPWAAIEEQPDGGVRVGALVKNSDMAQHELIRTRY